MSAKRTAMTQTPQSTAQLTSYKGSAFNGYLTDGAYVKMRYVLFLKTMERI